MKRKLLLVLLLVFGTLCSFAQQSVQGTPRVLKGAKSAPAVVLPEVDFSEVNYWVGNADGTNQAALVVKWDDGKGNNANYVWGYKWTENESPTGETMLRAIAAADPRFYMLVYGGTQYGAAIGGLGYDLDGKGNILLIKSSNTYSLVNGVYDCGDYSFDDYSSNDSIDRWKAGWYNGYWSYWTTDDVDVAYSYSSVGASSRYLVDGSIDGWSFMSDMSNWYSNDMSGTLEYVTSPSTAITRASDNSATSLLAETEGKTWTVNNIEEFVSAIENSSDGDIIKFREGLRGIEFENTLTYMAISKSLTIIGNGVILRGGSQGLFFTNGDGSKNQVIIKDFVFRDIQAIPISVCGPDVDIDGCIFDGCSSAKDGGGGIYYQFVTNQSEPNTVNITRCRFSNCSNTKSSKYGGAICVSAYNSETFYDLMHCNIVSCTFVGVQCPKKASAVYVVNYATVKLVNNIFEDNKSSVEGSVIPPVYFYKASADKACFAGYNVIHDTIAEDNLSCLSESDIQDTDLAASLALVDGEYQVVKGSPAYEHLPANPAVEGITFPERDVQGTIIDYSRPTHSGACQMVYEEGASVDYTQGVFFVNEDWYGHQNSTVNFLTNDGEWIYRVVQKENPGVELGCTNQYGAIYGDRFYLIAKQEKDPGASVTGGRLTVCDAKTMKVLKQFANISVDANGNSNADGRGFLGVDEHKGYVGTSNGIYVLDLDDLELKGAVTGSENIGGSAYDQLYSGQVGNMVRVGDRVFAVHQSKGLLVINPATDQVEKVIEGVEGWGFGSVVLSKDGNLWLSLASSSGSGQADTRIMKVNPYTLETEVIELPEGIYGPANSWYAWTPDCFCASQQQNVLYWNGGNSSWFSGYTVYKYDIDKNEFSTYIDYNGDPDGWQIYGCSFRVSPMGDEAFVSLFKSFGDPTYVVRKYDADGKQLAEYPMIQNYWFPSLPVFPDNEAPVVNNPDDVSITSDASVEVSLKDIATDADNFDAAIVKTVKSVSDETVVNAEIIADNLVITPLKKGDAVVTLGINSNGKLAEATVNVSIDLGTGIGNVEASLDKVEIYDINGVKTSTMKRGVNIIRRADGSIIKLSVRK